VSPNDELSSHAETYWRVGWLEKIGVVFVKSCKLVIDISAHRLSMGLRQGFPFVVQPTVSSRHVLQMFVVTGSRIHLLVGRESAAGIAR
jgi:hypothetical protein